jgi:hypothetical protein
LRLDAEWISPSGDEAKVWSAPPRPLFGPLPAVDLRASQGPRRGIAAIFGRWPGEEPEEEVEARLRELS